MRNTKGLSEIVATLIIILLTLVAVGIIWVVIRGVVTSGTNQISTSSECTAVNLNAVAAQETPAGSGVYTVTLHRASGGGNLSGVRVSILNASGVSSGPMDFGIQLNSLDQKTQTFTTGVTAITGGQVSTNVTNGDSVEYTPYFLDASGNEQDCSNTQTFSF